MRKSPLGTILETKFCHMDHCALTWTVKKLFKCPTRVINALIYDLVTLLLESICDNIDFVLLSNVLSKSSTFDLPLYSLLHKCSLKPFSPVYNAFATFSKIALVIQ